MEQRKDVARPQAVYNSRPCTPPADDTMESRLNDLESRVAFQDDLLETLNAIVAEQQNQIDLMQRQIGMLYDQLKSLSPTEIAMGNEQERPPHY